MVAMPPALTLRELVTSASNVAAELFASKGKLSPCYFIVSSDGNVNLLPPPPFDDKNLCMAIMRELLPRIDCVMYVFMDEAWLIQAQDEHDKMPADFSTHPDRREVVILSGEDSNQQMIGQRDIIRPKGGKAYLGELRIADYGQMRGQMIGMLGKPQGKPS